MAQLIGKHMENFLAAASSAKPVRLTWMRVDLDEFADLARDLEPDEFQVLVNFIVHYCKRRGDMPDDDGKMKRLLGLDARRWLRVKASLMAKGHLEMFGGRLISRIAERELSDGTKRIGNARNAGNKSAQIRAEQNGKFGQT